MPSSAKRRAYRPMVEDFERRDVPAAGVAGQAVEVVTPPAFQVQEFRRDLGLPIAPQTQALHRNQVFTAVAARSAKPIEARAAADPFAGLSTVGRDSLRPGDILVSTEDGGVSGAIRFATMSAYSHAALYVGNGKIIDATADGVRRRDLSALTEPATRVGVIRVNNLTTSQEAKTLATAGKLVGKSYNYFGLIFGGIVELLPIYRVFRAVSGSPLKVSPSALGPGYFCSELVIKAYKSAGITIAPEAGDTPAGIINYAMQRPSQFNLVGRLNGGRA